MAEYIEINLHNYDSSDVDQLNEWGMEAVEAIDSAVPVLADVLTSHEREMSPSLHKALTALINEFNRLVKE